MYFVTKLRASAEDFSLRKLFILSSKFEEPFVLIHLGLEDISKLSKRADEVFYKSGNLSPLVCIIKFLFIGDYGGVPLIERMN